jgi:hypothetical protein
MLEAPREEATGDGSKRRKDNRRLTWCAGKAKLPGCKGVEEVDTTGGKGPWLPDVDFANLCFSFIVCFDFTPKK